MNTLQNKDWVDVTDRKIMWVDDSGASPIIRQCGQTPQEEDLVVEGKTAV